MGHVRARQERKTHCFKDCLEVTPMPDKEKDKDKIKTKVFDKEKIVAIFFK